MITTALTESWGLRHPIVQAPMAGVSGGALAGAVASAGGLGFIGIGGAASPAWVADQAALARGAGGRWGFGLLVWHVAGTPEIVDAVLREEPDVVAVSFGDPAPYVGPCHDAGARVVAQVQDRATAERAAAAGVDALVAQGTDAGGHTGGVGTLPLLQLVLRVGTEAGLPVLAAGGVATGAGLAALLAAGADAAWIGTRFSATGEAMGSHRRKERLLDARETDTVHTRVFDIAQGAPWPEEFPGRALRNDFTARWHGRDEELASDPSAAGALERARTAGDFATMHVYAGQAVGLIDDLPPAGELVARLSREAESLLRRAATLVE
ncbi:MAG: NAD(P)H-dependent flavin oxidoreductase [Carbonactinosporaceae bacterium]